jgi:hypothetical protein
MPVAKERKNFIPKWWTEARKTSKRKMMKYQEVHQPRLRSIFLEEIIKRMGI